MSTRVHTSVLEVWIFSPPALLGPIASIHVVFEAETASPRIHWTRTRFGEMAIFLIV
jgi:hypothetical protein